MKKKNFDTKLYLGKRNVASFYRKTLKGGTANAADCAPPSYQCGTNNCGSNNCDTNSCPTVATCFADAALSCTPRGCGNTLFNC